VISKYFERPFFRDSVFCVGLLLVMSMLYWDSVINKSPGEPHLWRQSDCVALTHYYAKGAPLLEPEMYCRLGDDGYSGKTVAECPVLYYIIGKIWSVTGEHYWVYRGFCALFCVVALLCLYRTLLRLTKNWFWSVLGPLLLLASPVYAYFGVSFISNTPAFNCVLIAWYFFARYYSETKTKHLVWAAVFFSLAGLLKVSSMTSYIVLLFILLLDLPGIIRFKPDSKLFPKPLLVAGILILPLIIVLSWYLGYAEYYVGLHGGRYSVNSPDPIWNFSPEARDKVWSVWFQFTSQQIYPSYLWILFTAAAIFLMVLWRKVNPFWRVAIPMMFLGHTLFALLFFFSLDGHDYYHIDLLLFFVLTYAALAKFISSRESARRRKLVIRTAAVLILTWALLGSRNNVALRYYGNKGREEYSKVFATQKTIDFFNYFYDLHWFRHPYPKIADELTNHGFDENTVVYAVNDISFNSMLVMLRRPGFTGMLDFQFDSTYSMWRIERGAAVMIVENPEREWRPITKFMEHPLFTVEHITVYDLRPYRKRLPQPPPD
jgi:hypothetical protein